MQEAGICNLPILTLVSHDKLEQNLLLKYIWNSAANYVDTSKLHK